MAVEFPYLSVEPTPTVKGRSPGGGKLNDRSPERQAERLAARWAALESSLQQLEVEQAVPHDVDPELVIVFECAGDPQRTLRALQDFDTEAVSEGATRREADDDFHKLKIERDADGNKDITRTNSRLTTTIYAVMAAASQVRGILQSWRRYVANENVPSRTAHLFGTLYDLRVWDESDRLHATGLADQILENSAIVPAQPMTVHIEFFYRRRPEVRAVVQDRLEAIVTDAGGVVHCCYQRPEIGYHGMAVTVPCGLLVAADENGNPVYGALGESKPIQFVRPVPQAIEGNHLDGPETLEVGGDPSRMALGAVAVFDGAPVAQHDALSGRVDVLDIFDREAAYPMAARSHGTQMASCVVHGDLSLNEPSLDTKILHIPVLAADVSPGRMTETIPATELPVEVMWRAVTEMVDIVGGTIRVVNLSIGDPDAQFALRPSAWARAIDWLSHRHNLLFIIAAGNHGQLDRLGQCDAMTLFDTADAEYCRWLSTNRITRRLLSPAESVNAVTVGALYEDGASNEIPGRQVAADLGAHRVSPVSSFGGGVNRSIKPDVLFPGGRQTYVEPIDGQTRLRAARSPLPPGIKVAAPTSASPNGGVIFQAGTSHACALATRRASRLLDTLRSSLAPPEPAEPALLKALLVHGARATRQSDRSLADMYGFGPVDLDMSNGCAPHRATICAWGQIDPGGAVHVELPLPPGLASKSGTRTLSTTLAWLSPVNWAHRHYHQVKLNLAFESPNPMEPNSGSLKRDPVDWNRARNGTVVHDVRSGAHAVPLLDPNLRIRIERSDRAGTDDRPLWFGLAVTLDVDPALGVPVYEQVRAALQLRLPATRVQLHS